MTNKIDIGSIIKQTLRSKNISVAEFAEQIHCTQRNVYKIFNKQSIDTGLLEKISAVLGKNLFAYYLSAEDRELNNENTLLKHSA
jgi:transcriptional regulator with XRE-family HTH domain